MFDKSTFYLYSIPVRLLARGCYDDSNHLYSGQSQPGQIDPVALVAAEELSGLLETAHLLRSPANAQRLLAALARALNPEQTIPSQTIAELRSELGLNE
jgi:hypothetical protein